jgi:hypothetical protein
MSTVEVAVVLRPASRELRRSLRPIEWVVLEDVALDARRDDTGVLVASTSAREVAEHLGLTPGAVARALARLRSAGLVTHARQVGPAGRFGLSAGGPGFLLAQQQAGEVGDAAPQLVGVFSHASSLKSSRGSGCDPRRQPSTHGGILKGRSLPPAPIPRGAPALPVSDTFVPAPPTLTADDAALLTEPPTPGISTSLRRPGAGDIAPSQRTTAMSRHSVNANGKGTAELYAESAFRRQGGRWVDVDSTLRRSARAGQPVAAEGALRPVRFGSSAERIRTGPGPGPGHPVLAGHEAAQASPRGRHRGLP